MSKKFIQITYSRITIDYVTLVTTLTEEVAKKETNDKIFELLRKIAVYSNIMMNKYKKWSTCVYEDRISMDSYQKIKEIQKILYPNLMKKQKKHKRIAIPICFNENGV